MEIPTLTFEQQEANRKERLEEVGAMPTCPFCGKPRVARSDYLRCNPCGVNWLDEEMHLPNYINLDPRVARRAASTATPAKSSAETLRVDVER